MYKYFLSLLMLLIIPLFVYGQDMEQMSKDAKYKEVYNDVLNALTSGNINVLDKYVRRSTKKCWTH